MKNKFKGYYFKHQINSKTVAFIPGNSKDGAFIQVITDEKSCYFPVDSIDFGTTITAGSCRFGIDGIKIELPGISGKIAYSNITPLKSDIMGFFKYFPMECRHGIISMRHSLSGALRIEGEDYDFTGGTGYIEMDSGCSFPKNYLWLECNDFSDISLMAAIADIPFGGVCFRGCICAIVFGDKEYRLATYYGAKATIDRDLIRIKQGRYRLEISVKSTGQGHKLAAPVSGSMSGIIRENNSTRAVFRFYRSGGLLFERESGNVSYERFGAYYTTSN